MSIATDADAFSPSHNKNIASCQQVQKQKTTVVVASRLFDYNTQEHQQPPDDNGHDINDNYNVDGDDGFSDDLDLTIFQQAQILFYRTTLGASALQISIAALNDVSFLEGTGVNTDNILKVVDQSQTLLPLVVGTALLCCPVPRNRLVEIGASSLGALTFACGILSTIISPEQTLLFEEASWSLALLTLMAISIREIYYFGVEYKQECVLTLLTMPLMLDLHNSIPFVVPLCALGMCILAAGKTFEPLREDLVRSNSEFLAK